MTPYEIAGVVIVSVYYLTKWVRDKERKICEEVWDFDKKQTDNNINTEAKIVAVTPQGVVYDRPIIKGSFNTLLRPGMREAFREVYYPGKIFHYNPKDHTVEIEGGTIPVEGLYDEEYWRKWKTKHKHEEDEG